MPEYLTKEEIKEWRSSLEKITLEEFAARRGKVLEEQKHTNDLIDIVMKDQPHVIHSDSVKISETISQSPVHTEKVETKVNSKPVDEKPQKTQKNLISLKKVEKPKVEEPESTKSYDFTGVEFTKPLTDREQKVLAMFYKNAGQIVYAKDLAVLLDLPRDYVYKYIKTIRAKIKGDKLENADKGGYVLRI